MTFDFDKTSDVDVFLLIKNMKTFGGSFAASIGDALQHADAVNKRKLLDAFPELVERYSNSVWKA